MRGITRSALMMTCLPAKSRAGASAFAIDESATSSEAMAAVTGLRNMEFPPLRHRRRALPNGPSLAGCPRTPEEHDRVGPRSTLCSRRRLDPANVGGRRSQVIAVATRAILDGVEIVGLDHVYLAVTD